MNNFEKKQFKRVHRLIKKTIEESNKLGPLAAPIRGSLIQAEIIASKMRAQKP